MMHPLVFWRLDWCLFRCVCTELDRASIFRASIEIASRWCSNFDAESRQTPIAYTGSIFPTPTSSVRTGCTSMLSKFLLDVCEIDTWTWHAIKFGVSTALACLKAELTTWLAAELVAWLHFCSCKWICVLALLPDAVVRHSLTTGS